MKFAKLLFFLAFSILLISGCNLPKTEIDQVSPDSIDPYPGSPTQVYPPPQTPTLVLAPTSSPETPNPALSGANPIPDDQSFDQAALAYVAQITRTGTGSLSLVENSTVLLPITQKRLWNGIIVHPNQNGGDVYPVLIDAD